MVIYGMKVLYKYEYVTQQPHSQVVSFALSASLISSAVLSGKRRFIRCVGSVRCAVSLSSSLVAMHLHARRRIHSEHYHFKSCRKKL